jgi:peroxiredoxin
MSLAIGTKAPDFTLKSKTSSGLVEKRLSDHFGKKHTILLFVPAAFTSVCTKELCTFDDAHFKEYADADIWGISVDSPFAQEAWAKQDHIKITLLSDYTQEVSEQYDALLENLAGLGPASARVVYLIDKEGVIRYCQDVKLDQLPDFEALKKAYLAL